MRVLVGTDCEEIERWIGLNGDDLEDPRFPLFSKAEHAYCSMQAEPAQHYAVRWCAKEAVRKALAPVVTVDLRRVEVQRSENGVPSASIADLDLNALGISLSLSMSHSEYTAIASVVAVLSG